MNDQSEGLTLTLREAVERFRQERGSYSNAYDWYRRLAQRAGRAPIGVADVRATKVGGTWMMNIVDFEAAIAEHRAVWDEMRKITEDFHNHVLHGGPDAVLVSPDQSLRPPVSGRSRHQTTRARPTIGGRPPQGHRADARLRSTTADTPGACPWPCP